MRHLPVDIKVKQLKYVLQTDPVVSILFFCAIMINLFQDIVLSYELLMLTSVLLIFKKM